MRSVHTNSEQVRKQTKKVNAMNFYADRMMVRENEEIHLLECCKLFHQFAVDMYAKIESDRSAYIRLNQSKLRSEAYIYAMP